MVNTRVAIRGARRTKQLAGLVSEAGEQNERSLGKSMVRSSETELGSGDLQNNHTKTQTLSQTSLGNDAYSSTDTYAEWVKTDSRREFSVSLVQKKKLRIGKKFTKPIRNKKIEQEPKKEMIGRRWTEERKKRHSEIMKRFWEERIREKGNRLAIASIADLSWRSRLLRHRSGVQEALGSNPGEGMAPLVSGEPWFRKLESLSLFFRVATSELGPNYEQVTLVAVNQGRTYFVHDVHAQGKQGKVREFHVTGKSQGIFTWVRENCSLYRERGHGGCAIFTLPTKANRDQSPAGLPDFRKWESCRTMPLVEGFYRGYPVSSAPSFQRRSIFTSITLIGSEDLDVKSRPNLFTHSLHREQLEIAVLVQLGSGGGWGRCTGARQRPYLPPPLPPPPQRVTLETRGMSLRNKVPFTLITVRLPRTMRALGLAISSPLYNQQEEKCKTKEQKTTPKRPLGQAQRTRTKPLQGQQMLNNQTNKTTTTFTGTRYGKKRQQAEVFNRAETWYTYRNPMTMQQYGDSDLVLQPGSSPQRTATVQWRHGGQTTCLQSRRTGFDSQWAGSFPGFSHVVIVPDDPAGRQVFVHYAHRLSRPRCLATKISPAIQYAAIPRSLKVLHAPPDIVMVVIVVECAGGATGVCRDRSNRAKRQAVWYRKNGSPAALVMDTEAVAAATRPWRRSTLSNTLFFPRRRGLVVRLPPRRLVSASISHAQLPICLLYLPSIRTHTITPLPAVKRWRVWKQAKFPIRLPSAPNVCQGGVPKLLPQFNPCPTSRKNSTALRAPSARLVPRPLVCPHSTKQPSTIVSEPPSSFRLSVVVPRRTRRYWITAPRPDGFHNTAYPQTVTGVKTGFLRSGEVGESQGKKAVRATQGS
ncbi:hypothetical protein PR048_008716 [Dryococelus australis]|uniref:Uncharacterized protein n=1 Tax=Dryococelus australis TaxID=614101 RepID=A0ABQ9HXX3_9NEOP|nr:hypothetical protein PR048_008716 [Dryococelus australis]